MKRFVIVLTTMFCLMFAFGLNTKAAAYGDLTYTIRNGSIVITGCSERAVSVKIPSTIAGKKVTVIGDYAFNNVFGCLRSVIIPNSVKIIGNYAFEACRDLRSITIPSSVTSIGECAFSNCKSLKSITIPNNVTYIGEYAFSNCTSLKTITIPSSVKTIGPSAFEFCDNLTSVTILKGVTTISNSIFQDCTRLKSVTIPDSVTDIEDRSFLGCESLMSITIPDSVKTIGEIAFFRCDSLKSITIPKNVKTIGENAIGFIFDEKDSEDKIHPGFTIKGYYDSAAETYAKKNGIKFVSLDRAPKVGSSKTVGGSIYVITSANTARFKKPLSKKITRIKVPKKIKINRKSYKVTAIGKKAFVGCSKLKKVIITGTIKKIGKNAFYKCKKLKTIRIYSKKLTKDNVLTGAFKGISKKATFYVPKGKKAAYKRMLLKRGAKKTMKFETN